MQSSPELKTSTSSMLSPLHHSRGASGSRLSLRSCSRTTSSALSSVTTVNSHTRRCVYTLDIAALRAKAAGISSGTSPSPLRLTSKSRRVEGILHLDDLHALARGTKSASSVRSLSRAFSSVGSSINLADPWSPDSSHEDLLEEACSSECLNVKQFLKPRLLRSPNVHSLAQSIDNMHLTKYLPRSPRVMGRRMLKQPETRSPTSDDQSPEIDLKTNE